MPLPKTQIVHIVVEIILLIAISMYFQSQNKKLKQDIETLKQYSLKHEQALKVLFANVNIKKGLPPQSQQPQSQQPQQTQSNVQSNNQCPLEEENDNVEEYSNRNLETIEEEEENDEEFDKEVEKELNDLDAKEQKTSSLDEPEIDFDISSQSPEKKFAKSEIDTVIVIGQDNESEQKSQVEFLPPKRKRVTKKK